MRRLLVTGSSGLIGSEVVAFFCHTGWEVHGMDNNMRKDFFGPQGDTRWNRERLLKAYTNFQHHEMDIRDRAGVARLIADLKPDAIVHNAAQPSHDLAASRPYDDFDVNSVGTLNLLEAARRSCRPSSTCPPTRSTEMPQPGLTSSKKKHAGTMLTSNMRKGSRRLSRSTTPCIRFLVHRRSLQTLWFKSTAVIPDADLLPSPSRSLIVADLLFNLSEKDAWITRVMGSLVIGPYPGCRFPRLYWPAVRNRRRMRASVERILDWDFDRIIVGHGAVVETNGKEVFRVAFQWLLK